MNSTFTELTLRNIDKLGNLISEQVSLLFNFLEEFKLFQVDIQLEITKFTSYFLSNFSPESLLNSVLFLVEPDLNDIEKRFLSGMLGSLDQKCNIVLYPASPWLVKHLPGLFFAFPTADWLVASHIKGRKLLLENHLSGSLPIPALIHLSKLLVVFKYRLSRELLAITELALDASKEILVFSAPCWDSQYSGNLTLIREGVMPLTGKPDLELYI